MMTFVDSIDAVDAKTFTIKLKEPTGLVLLGLSKPSSNVPFMMPKRVAETDPNKQIEDFTGSGPFVFAKDEWKPGDKTVYVKFDKYKPRSEPAVRSGGRQGRQGGSRRVARHLRRAAGGQRAAKGRDRHGRAAQPRSARPAEEGSQHRRRRSRRWRSCNTSSDPTTCTSRSTTRRSARRLWYAFNQEDFLMATIGDENYIKVVQGAVHLRHAVRRRPRELDAFSPPTSRRRRNC